jgi:hypothetical protein
MGRRSFHGQVVTLADACEADYLVIVKCQSCGARRQMHPFKLISRRKPLMHSVLDTSLPGFFCKACGRDATVTISCTHTHPGSM